MTCCTESAVAAASAAIFAALLDFGSASAASAIDFENYSPASVALADFRDAARSDTFTPVREPLAALRMGDSTGFAAPLRAGERSASGCRWSASSRFCEKVERSGSVRVADRWSSVDSTGAASLEPVVVNAPARRPEGSPTYQLTKIAVVSGQPSLATPESLGRISTPASGPLPLSRPSSGIREISFDISTASDEGAPGPYAMLFIGVSLAAFMAFRRLGQV